MSTWYLKGSQDKKSTIQVSYLSEIVSTSRFGICNRKNISLGSDREIPKFWVFWAFSLSPTNSVYLSRLCSPFWHSEMIVNITGDECGSILIFTVFWFGPFFVVFGHFWAFLAFLGFRWRFLGIGSASEF